jgi:hypothetical protein
MSILLWGDAGCGKTTLAATAPGRKLWFNFDPDGTNTLAGVPEDVEVYDLSQVSPTTITEMFKNETNPLGIKSVIDQYDTFVIDSLTNVTDKTLTVGIKADVGSTIETPSPRAYGTRNALAIRLVKNILAATFLKKKHVILIAHEGAPVTNPKTGVVMHITLALGGQLPSNIGLDLSEIWHLYQVDNRNERRLMIRNSRNRKPTKTRMWIQSGESEFPWNFNADKWDSETNKPYRIDTWFNMWMAQQAKLHLPGTPEFIKLMRTEK